MTENKSIKLSKKLRERTKKWRSTNLKNGALSVSSLLKYSKRWRNPHILRHHQGTERNWIAINKTHQILLIRQWQKGIWAISQKQRNNEIKIFSVEAEFFFVKKVLGIDAKNRQFWGSSASIRQYAQYVVAYQFSKGLRKVVPSPVNESSQVNDLRCAFFNDDRTLIHLYIMAYIVDSLSRAYGNRQVGR